MLRGWGHIVSFFFVEKPILVAFLLLCIPFCLSMFWCHKLVSDMGVLSLLIILTPFRKKSATQYRLLQSVPTIFHDRYIWKVNACD